MHRLASNSLVLLGSQRLSRVVGQEVTHGKKVKAAMYKQGQVNKDKQCDSERKQVEAGLA